MEVIVISLGGSIINQGEINISFLKKFKKLIMSREEKFIIICGGGKPVRDYQKASKELEIDTEGRDWIGIAGTMFNAELVKELFGKEAYVDALQEPQKIEFDKVIVAGGWKPGCSTDKDAILWAEKFNSGKVFNLSNIDMVYDKDPNKYKDAKPFKKITWDEYKEKITSKWSPGLNTPFDPIASKLAADIKLKVYIINGRELDRLEKALNNKEFIGTIIQ